MEYYIYTAYKPDIHKILWLHDIQSQCYYTAIIVAMYLIELNLYGELKDNCKWLNLNSNKIRNVH